MSPIRRLAFVVNTEKPGAAQLARELIAIARTVGVRRIKSRPAHKLPRGYFKGSDAGCIIGGDGTLLGAVTEAATAGVPLIGVNQGSLGYLTSFSPEEARACFGEVLLGQYRVAPRTLLECRTAPRRRDLALNDVLIKAEVNSQLVRLEVRADGELVTDYLCDGLVLSTPTGSTAYNLSAGGPILHPAAGVIAMTPICPHTLSNRTIVFNDGVKLSIRNCSPDSRLLVALDGQRNRSVVHGSSVEVTIAKRHLGLVQRRDYRHFSVMRAKLKWSGGLTDKK
ncbi:putative inorganic polyphosphate/ATP-NAD kinase [Lacunisphaera limnophila]|uniref:NAD kinase n=1 Tax=Lacunisphaera limnophila TaxID=1838286 RepID=A0A1D8AZK4_9BACT|nr:NAD(+)/NADH kinase [Lacunisphaera limnophila]AOS46319.1 putative inorganic polyphosphate/ATP-NAD kinase [Lacunisphaera limnophila]